MFKYYFPDHIVVLIIRKRLLLQGVEFETDDFLPKKKISHQENFTHVNLFVKDTRTKLLLY